MVTRQGKDPEADRRNLARDASLLFRKVEAYGTPEEITEVLELLKPMALRIAEADHVKAVQEIENAGVRGA
jgi:hypothetical protein